MSPGRSPKRAAHSAPAEGRWQRRSAQAAVVGVLATVALGVAVPLGWLSSGSSAAHIRPEQLLVRESNQSPRQQIEATVLNTGGTTAVIKSASLKVLHVYSLPICYSQGSIPVSATYGAALPREISRGAADVVHVPLHDEARPGESDRFAILLRVAKGPEKRYATRLYQIALSIISGSDSHESALGKFVISLPYPLTANEQYWTKELASESRAQLVQFFGTDFARALACYRANAATLNRALRLAGIRPSGLEKVTTELAAPPEVGRR